MTYEFQTPTSGSTVSASSGVTDEVLTPVSGGFAISYVLPPSPHDGDKHHVALGILETALLLTAISTSDGTAIAGRTAGGSITYAEGVSWIFNANVGAHGTWYNNS